jgi:hypothetical protein
MNLILIAAQPSYCLYTLDINEKYTHVLHTVTTAVFRKEGYKPNPDGWILLCETWRSWLPFQLTAQHMTQLEIK